MATGLRDEIKNNARQEAGDRRRGGRSLIDGFLSPPSEARSRKGRRGRKAGGFGAP